MKKGFKVIALFLIITTILFLITVGVLWLLNQYGVINVQTFLDFLYYKMIAIIGLISAIDVGAVVYFIVNIVYNHYRNEQNKQSLTNQSMQMIIIKKIETIEEKIDYLIAYETIMANRQLTNAVVVTKEDKKKLREWISSAKTATKELAEKAKEYAVNNVSTEKFKSSLSDIESKTLDEIKNHAEELVKGMM